MAGLVLQLIAGEFAICQLPAPEPDPPWAGSAVFSAITRTADELSVICPASQVPAEVKHDGGWRLLKFHGPFAFTEMGILASALVPLAAAKISTLAMATFDTDHLLVKSTRLDDARRALETAGHTVIE